MTSELALLESVQHYMLETSSSLLSESNRELISASLNNAIDNLGKFLSEPQTRIFTIIKGTAQGNFFYKFLIFLF